MKLEHREETIKELIRLCLKYRASVDLEPKLTETAIQKILYKLKCELPQSNKIKDELPYYWFKAGAYSELVSNTLHKMQRNKVLIPARKKHRLYKKDYLLFELNKKYLNKKMCKHDTDLIQATRLLKKIIEEMEPFSLDKEIHFQYHHSAPLLFYPRFNLELMPSLDLYYDSINSSQVPLEFDNSISLQRETLLKLLNLASSSLPFTSVFSDFKRSYFEFESSLSSMLKWQPAQSKYSDYRTLIKESAKLTAEIWETFAYGARLLQHDAFYQTRVSSWTKIFEEKVESMKSKVKEFYVYVLRVIGPKEFNEIFISLPSFTKMLVEAKRKNQIMFINFQSVKDATRIRQLVSDDVKEVPEFETFLMQGQLDAIVIKLLSDEQFGNMISESLNTELVFVGFSEPPMGPRVVTYRIESKSLSAVTPIGAP